MARSWYIFVWLVVSCLVFWFICLFCCCCGSGGCFVFLPLCRLVGCLSVVAWAVGYWFWLSFVHVFYVLLVVFVLVWHS